MEERTQKLYYAVNGSGQGMIFTELPERDYYYKCWVGEMVACYQMVVMTFESNGFSLPVLSWHDEPVMLTMCLKYG